MLIRDLVGGVNKGIGRIVKLETMSSLSSTFPIILHSGDLELHGEGITKPCSDQVNKEKEKLHGN
jgi:hypothetical protein